MGSRRVRAITGEWTSGLVHVHLPANEERSGVVPIFVVIRILFPIKYSPVTISGRHDWARLLVVSPNTSIETISWDFITPFEGAPSSERRPSRPWRSVTVR